MLSQSEKHVPSILDKILAHKPAELEAVTPSIDSLRATVADAPDVRNFAAALAGECVRPIKGAKSSLTVIKTVNDTFSLLGPNTIGVRRLFF